MKTTYRFKGRTAQLHRQPGGAYRLAEQTRPHRSREITATTTARARMAAGEALMDWWAEA